MNAEDLVRYSELDRLRHSLLTSVWTMQNLSSMCDRLRIPLTAEEARSVRAIVRTSDRVGAVASLVIREMDRMESAADGQPVTMTPAIDMEAMAHVRDCLDRILKEGGQ